ncbi:hypothetical protein RN001_015269 [Aquatica leii]|uniref:tRNA (guanine-N(7)-)-methyltransferase non-catalytic subunit wuho n=1 Tax=Aquatica leii TaxID=1421715 RepID=A0AAN7SNG3_9COLE|nr:hypothetical protein RN001_015269 [Aquatica leii]
MILLREYQGKLLLLIKDTIACYDHKSDTYEEFNIPQLQPNLENRLVSSVCSSKHDDFLAVSLSNKQLIIFDKKFNVLTNTLSKRVVSKIRFTPDNDLLVADKTGDVFVYKGNNIEPKLLLGHLSMLLDIEVTDCGKYVITSDRDEKIRVSCYPNSYNIVSFCLGHREFVTNISVCGKVLVSASGDGTIRLWNYLTGEELAVANCNEYITDKSIIGNFSKEMSAESVDVDALPITDMQVYAKQDLIYVGVTVLGINGVQMYFVDVSNAVLSVKYLQTVVVSSPLLTYYLREQLIILTTNELAVLDVCSDKCNPLNSDISRLFKHCKHLLINYENLSNSFVSTLYKRKYDNVQDYLEKKKIRLENKS